MPILVGDATIAYAQTHKNERLDFLRALKVMDDVTPQATPDLTCDAIFAAVAAVMPDLPAAYGTALSDHRTAMGVGGAFASLSTANKQKCIIVVRGWLNTRAVFGDFANEVLT